MATKKSKVEEVNVLEALLEATGQKPMKKKETPVEFATRIAEAVAELDEDAYDAMPEEVTAWYEKAVKAMNKDKEPPVIPGTEPAEADAEAEEEEAPKAKRGGRKAKTEEEDEEEEEEKPKRGGRKAKAEDEEEEPAPKKGRAKKAKAEDDEEDDEKPAKKSRKAKDDEERGPSIADLTITIVCKSPKLSLEQVEAKVGKALGREVEGSSQISAIYRRTQRAIEVLTELGKLS